MRTRLAAFASGLSFTLLRTFVRVVETGNISAAARSLYSAQSAVSAQIAALNRLVGSPLLERVNNRWQPTTSGGIFYKRASEMLLLLDQTQRDLVDVTARASGHLVIASTRTITDAILADILHGFAGSHPDIRIEVKAGNREDAERWIAGDEVDLALVAMPLGLKGLEIHPFATDELVAAIPIAHVYAGRESISLDEVEGVPCVTFEKGSGVRALLEERLGERFEHLDIRMELNSNDALLSCVERGIGITFLPRRTAERWQRCSAIATVPISGVDLRRELALVVRKERSRSAAANAFIAWLEDYARLSTDK